MGDLLALLAAVCWSAANVTIARGAGGKGDDNGAFLSILLTAALAALVWLIGGLSGVWLAPVAAGVFWFAVAGALTIFIGRVFFHSSIQWLGAIRGSSVKRLAPFFSVLLGVLLLGEPLSWTVVGGMSLIFAGFGVLIQESMASGDRSGRLPRGVPSIKALKVWTNPGLAYGAISALAYATGNIARKYGLLEMPDPAFGAMMGSLVGAALFLLTSVFAGDYRHAVRSTFTRFNPWLFVAGLMASAGQLLFFVAIDYSTVSRAALIASSEVFMTMGLTATVFRGREKLSRAAMFAALLGVLGTMAIMTEGTDARQAHNGPAGTGIDAPLAYSPGVSPLR